MTRSVPPRRGLGRNGTEFGAKGFSASDLGRRLALAGQPLAPLNNTALNDAAMGAIRVTDGHIAASSGASRPAPATGVALGAVKHALLILPRARFS
jgi:hypothetical protein